MSEGEGHWYRSESEDAPEQPDQQEREGEESEVEAHMPFSWGHKIEEGSDEPADEQEQGETDG